MTPIIHTAFLTAFAFLNALPVHAESIRLAWDPPSDGSRVSYLIEQRTSTGSYTLALEVAAGVTTSVVSGLTPGERYHFVVRAVDATGTRSGASNEVSAVAPGGVATPPPSPPPPPSSPPPSGAESMKVVYVSTETALQTAVGNLQSATRIVIAKGAYTLTRPLVLPTGLEDIELASATGRASDVVLFGTKGTTAQRKPGIVIATDVTRLTLANLTLRSAAGYPVVLRGAMVDPRLTGLRFRDDGQFVSATLDPVRGATGGLVENCLFEYVSLGTNVPVGIDVSNGQRWVIRGNRFVDANPLATRIGGPVIFAWGGSDGTLVERNTFINTSREIVLGLEDRTPNQSNRGIVRNNMIVRKANTGFRGAAISILDSPDTVVVHNSVLLAGTSKLAIDFAHRDTSNTYIAGNLLDGSITSRDGASGLVEGNYLLATPAMFVAPATADLRLRPDSAGAVIDRGIFTEFAPTDFQGEARPSGGAVDIGADEVVR